MCTNKQEVPYRPNREVHPRISKYEEVTKTFIHRGRLI